MQQIERVFVLGLDCMTPQLTFERWIDDLPTFKRIMTEGVWGRMRSVIPAIKLIESRKYPLEELVTHRFSLEEAEKAILTAGGMIEGENPIKVIINPHL